ncbi:MAG TPA: hypothetical protein VH351_13825 [Bryobacteraceae bacterium]|jgi:hypothetical protein|nr:hypothetical protein [Bryobacteraceae bacterium]
MPLPDVLKLSGKLAGYALILHLVTGANALLAHDRNDDDDCDSMRVKLTVFDPSISGHAEICFGHTGVSAEVRAAGLVPDDAYTVWFAYIDNPALCQTPGCGDSDWVGPNPPLVFGRLDSGVAHRRGVLSFAGSVRGLKLSPGSIVWLVMVGHGQANMTDYRLRARQLLTPQDPGLGAPGLGVPADHAVTAAKAIGIFQIPR